MSKIIAFSGGCFSGKTTTIKFVKNYLKEAGYKTQILGELIRTTMRKPIDELRNNPSEYLKVQYSVIMGKIAQEDQALADTSETVYLADRAITDSLFYLQNYVDKSKLSSDEIRKYCALHEAVIKHATKMFDATKNGYFLIVKFSPMHSNEDVNDTYRPENIHCLKYYEHDAIEINNTSFAAKCTNYVGDMAISTEMIDVDLNLSGPEQVADYIKFKLGEYGNKQ